MRRRGVAGLTQAEVAGRIGVSPGTLRRWVREGLVPLPEGAWTPAACAHARIVARLRARGHPMQAVREASRTGRLAYGYVEELFPAHEARHSFAQAARETGLEPAVLARLWAAIGVPAGEQDALSDEDVALLRDVAAVLSTGFPLVALLQVVRVYGQALAQIADA